VYNIYQHMADSDRSTNEQIFAKWTIPAYPHYERGTLWYVITGIVSGIILVIAFLTYNFLLAVIIVMVAVVMVIQGGVKPPDIEVEVSQLGIRRGSHYFPYSSIDHFWIVYDPPIKSLHFHMPRTVFPMNHIPLDGQNPVELRAFLKKHLREDIERDSEPVMDMVSRILKI